jgi:hypothetical protein
VRVPSLTVRETLGEVLVLSPGFRVHGCRRKPAQFWCRSVSWAINRGFRLSVPANQDSDRSKRWATRSETNRRLDDVATNPRLVVAENLMLATEAYVLFAYCSRFTSM